MSNIYTNTLLNDSKKDIIPKSTPLNKPNYLHNVLPQQVNMNPLSFRSDRVNNINSSLDLLEKTDYLLNKSTIKDTSNEIKDFDNSNTVKQGFVPYDSFTKPEFLFNNINGDGRIDTIIEYIVHVNSSDRNISEYPNPFKYKVNFLTTSSDKNATIQKSFTNVRYIKIETCTFPRLYKLSKTQISTNPLINPLFDNLPNSNYNFIMNDINYTVIISYNLSNKLIINYTETLLDPYECMTKCYETIKINNSYTTFKYEIINKKLDNEKYIVASINEINNVSSFSTDKLLSTAFTVLYPENVNETTLYTESKLCEKIYKYSDLGNINKITLSLYDPLGKLLDINTKALDMDINLINYCNCSTDNNGNNIRNYSCICSYIRHPLYTKFQNNIMFKIGVVETTTDKRMFN
jgi:hypothetical protein